jgi:hypothetical protein
VRESLLPALGNTKEKLEKLKQKCVSSVGTFTGRRCRCWASDYGKENCCCSSEEGLKSWCYFPQVAERHDLGTRRPISTGDGLPSDKPDGLLPTREPARQLEHRLLRARVRQLPQPVGQFPDAQAPVSPGAARLPAEAVLYRHPGLRVQVEPVCKLATAGRAPRGAARTALHSR